MTTKTQNCYPSKTPARSAVNDGSTFWSGWMTSGCNARRVGFSTTRWRASYLELPMANERTETFEFDRAGDLVRRVIPQLPHQPYEHRCTLVSYQQVAQEADELGQVGFTGEELARRTDVPFSQVATAIAFMKERGCIVTECKRNYAPADGDIHLDAMIEFHAQREKSAGG